jgi:lysophospholipase L1-like esterase
MKRQALFIGDSLIEFFDWQARFPELEVTNAGRAGETAQELLQRLVSFQVDMEGPDLVVIMAHAPDRP